MGICSLYCEIVAQQSLSLAFLGGEICMCVFGCTVTYERSTHQLENIYTIISIIKQLKAHTSRQNAERTITVLKDIKQLQFRTSAHIRGYMSN